MDSEAITQKAFVLRRNLKINKSNSIDGGDVLKKTLIHSHITGKYT